MSKIEWTDTTWNVITGCTQISPACQNCYAKAMTKRLQGMANAHFKRQFPEDSVLRFNDDGSINDLVFKGEYRALYPQSKAKLKYISGWDKVIFHTDMLGHIFDTKKYPSGCKVFVNSMSDTFHEDISFLDLENLFFVMQARSDLTFLILTKRPLRMWDFIISYPDMIKQNMIFGVTAENQEFAYNRITKLLKIKEQAKKTFDMDIKVFVSCEPLLEPIDLSDYIKGLDWVIVGGERANKKGRAMEYKWVKKIYTQCKKHGVPFFFKQWGDYEKEAKAKIVGDDLVLCEIIENKKEFVTNKQKEFKNEIL